MPYILLSMEIGIRECSQLCHKFCYLIFRETLSCTPSDREMASVCPLWKFISGANTMCSWTDYPARGKWPVAYWGGCKGIDEFDVG